MSSNASPSAFGWDFQVNAAIVLMLENIHEVDEIRVEGELEDIELKLKNGKYIYSQAKSVIDREDYRNVRAKLKKALKTLSSAAKNNNYDKLIYVTNSPNPFGIIDSMQAFYGDTHLNFQDLPESCKSIINNYQTNENNYDLDKSRLLVRVIPFHTEFLPERYKVVKGIVADFLGDIDTSTSGIVQKILEVWQRDLFLNCTMGDTEIKIKKSEFVWPIVVLMIEVNRSEKVIQELDDSDIDEVVNKYQDIINNKVDRFEFATKVLSDYNNFTTSSNKKCSEFISNEWRKYKNDFNVNLLDEEIIENLIKIVIYKIIRKKHLINNIKKKVKL